MVVDGRWNILSTETILIFPIPPPKNPSDMLPHTREIIDRIEGNGGIDRPSLPRDRHLKGRSLETCNFTSSRRPKDKKYSLLGL